MSHDRTYLFEFEFWAEPESKIALYKQISQQASRLAKNGLSKMEIAVELGVDPKTVLQALKYCEIEWTGRTIAPK